MHGFVYIMSNPAMPGYFKVGMTERSPLKRAGELSSSTSVPFPFQLLAYVLTEAPHEAEQALHHAMRHLRASASREFFFAQFSEIAHYLHEEHEIILTRMGCWVLGHELHTSYEQGEYCSEAQYVLAGRAARDDWREVWQSFDGQHSLDLNEYLETFLTPTLRVVGKDA